MRLLVELSVSPLAPAKPTGAVTSDDGDQAAGDGAGCSEAAAAAWT